MRLERQAELLRRLEASCPTLDSEPWPQAEASWRCPASTYVDPAHFERERQVLFRQGPVMLGLTAECAGRGAYLTGDLGGVPVVVVRQRDGSLEGFANICRHRGAALVDGCGRASALSCPYHAWTYGLDGRLVARPATGAAFDDVPADDMHLLPIAVGEKHGLIFARAEGDGPVDVDAALHGAQDELADYGLDRYHPFETRTTVWDFNWKLVLDTFLESYHIRALHRESIWPTYLSNTMIVDGFGPHPRTIGLLRSVLGEFDKPEAERRLLPHATTQYVLVPSGLLVYQRNHFQLWRVQPLAVDRTRVSTSLFTAEPAETDKARAYWKRNLDILLDVTGREDFPVMAQIHRNLASGVLKEVVYGRLEPGLIHFHSALARTLASAGQGGDGSMPTG